MSTLSVVATNLALVASLVAQVPDQEAQVRQAVEAFYAAFNADGFDAAPDFTTDDWHHITPLGGWTRGRVETQRQIQEVHNTFLKGVSEAIEQMDVRFATADVAVVTVTGRSSPFTTPDGVRRENQQHIRTFVVVQRGTRWLIMHDHNTFVTPPQSPAGR